jgi:hypothetical protein
MFRKLVDKLSKDKREVSKIANLFLKKQKASDFRTAIISKFYPIYSFDQKEIDYYEVKLKTKTNDDYGYLIVKIKDQEYSIVEFSFSK